MNTAKADQIINEMKEETYKQELQAGTGFMASLSDRLNRLKEKGYSDNIVSKYDHFEVRSGEIKLGPGEFKIDKIERFENTSDPDDQAILYAISSTDGKVKGVYVESYGFHHEDISKEMLECLKDHPH